MSGHICSICSKKESWWTGKFVGDVAYCDICFREKKNNVDLPEEELKSLIFQKTQFVHSTDSDYPIALNLSELTHFIGVFTILIGAMLSFANAIDGFSKESGIIPIEKCFGLLLLGLALILASQITNAIIAKADYSRDLLKVFEKKA